MADVREAILARIRALLPGIPGLATGGVGRNRGDISPSARPAIILHDGSEEKVDLRGNPRGGVLQLVKLNPQLEILVGAGHEDVGTLINGFRALLLSAVLNDATILSYIGRNPLNPADTRFGSGDIAIESCELETQAGETREGRMAVNLAITYALVLADLPTNVPLGPPAPGLLPASLAKIIVKTSAYSIVGSDSGVYFTNAGAGGAVPLSLPPASPGLVYAFVVMAPEPLEIIATSGQTITIGNDATASGGNVQSAFVGSALVLIGTDTAGWESITSSGRWDIN